MIKEAKKQLSKNSFIACLLFFSCIIPFFFYALKFDSRFSYILFAVYSLLAVVMSFSFQDSRRREGIIFLQKQDYQERINLLTAKINSGNLSISYLRQKIISYSSLKEIIERLTNCLTLNETAQALSSQACNMLGNHDRFCILYLFEPSSLELSIIATKKGEESQIIKAKKGDIFDSWVIKKLQPLLVEDTKKDFRFDLERVQREETRNLRSLVSAPLIIGRQVLGILRVDSTKENSFTFDDLRLLSTISDLGAMAIGNAILYEKTEELAIKDGLTGLYLRRYLAERLSEEIMRALRTGFTLSLLMLDIDHFKIYNDKFGHVAGDIVLKAIAKLLLENFAGAGNIVSRYGGEEFAVLLPNCPKKDAFSLAERVRKRIKEEKISLRKKPTQVTVSIGLSSFPQDAKTREDLILKADTALYQAKQAGRDKVCLA